MVLFSLSNLFRDSATYILINWCLQTFLKHQHVSINHNKRKQENTLYKISKHTVRCSEVVYNAKMLDKKQVAPFQTSFISQNNTINNPNLSRLNSINKIM